jgi:hypothetical protein
MQQNGQNRGERSRRTFTIADYREALRVLDARRAEAPGLRVELARQVTANADRVTEPPPSGVRRRLTLVGSSTPPPMAPVTAAVQRAAGLGPRPSGRDR